jgi:hypothetical protein
LQLAAQWHLADASGVAIRQQLCDEFLPEFCAVVCAGNPQGPPALHQQKKSLPSLAISASRMARGSIFEFRYTAIRVIHDKQLSRAERPDGPAVLERRTSVQACTLRHSLPRQESNPRQLYQRDEPAQPGPVAKLRGRSYCEAGLPAVQGAGQYDVAELRRGLGDEAGDDTSPSGPSKFWGKFASMYRNGTSDCCNAILRRSRYSARGSERTIRTTAAARRVHSGKCTAITARVTPIQV